MVRPLLMRLRGSVRGEHDWNAVETYTVVFVRRLEGDPSAGDVLAAPSLASLVLGEPTSRRLSPSQRQDVLTHSHSYFDDDLVVVDWNCAFVLEPSGSRDIPDILELASSQLLELRYYDELFDAELARVYRDLDCAHGRKFGDIVRNPLVDPRAPRREPPRGAQRVRRARRQYAEGHRRFLPRARLRERRTAVPDPVLAGEHRRQAGPPGASPHPDSKRDRSSADDVARARGDRPHRRRGAPRRCGTKDRLPPRLSRGCPTRILPGLARNRAKLRHIPIGLANALGLAHGLDELLSRLAAAGRAGVRCLVLPVDGYALLRQLALGSCAE